MSSSNQTNMNTLEPEIGAPAAGSGGSGGKSKALRTDSKGEAEGGGAGVFRLESLAPGAAQDGSGPISTPPGAKISHAAVFFLILIVVGGALLLVMRKIGINPMSAIARMQEPEIDLTKSKGAVDHTRVLRDLSESAVKGQVPIDQVQKNPFEIPEVAGPDTDPEIAKRKAEEKRRKEMEARKQRMDAALATLKVHGIINGAVPVARINDQAVRVGDVVDDLFTVESIAGRSVVLRYEEQAWTISIDDHNGPVSKAPKKK